MTLAYLQRYSRRMATFFAGLYLCLSVVREVSR